MRRSIIPLAALALTTGLVKSACGCSSHGSGPATDAGDESFERRDASSIDALGDVVIPSPLDGWESFGDYDPRCGFFIPSVKDRFPPPIQWEPCDTGVQPGGISCRQMREDWAPWPASVGAGGETFTSPAISGAPNSTGGVSLMLSRFVKAPDLWVYRLVADADGVVHQAILETASTMCTAGDGQVRDGKYAFTISDTQATGKISDFGGGVLAGNIDDSRPTSFLHFNDKQAHSVIVGTPGVIDLPTLDTLNLHSWSNPSSFQTIWSPGQDNGLMQNWVFFFGTTIFWSSDVDAYNKLKVYTAAGGVKDFVTFGSDPSRGAADLGTDGTDLLWTVGSGRSTSNGLFPTVSIMTSPFTTDPTLLQPRRLRSEISNGLGASPFVVACGYGARQTYEGIRVVRVRDGQSWLLSGTPGLPWEWTAPVALTCTELFAKVESLTPSAHLTLARVRLDSLGPGIPAD